MKKELKQAKIINGKICLEDEVKDFQILGLSVTDCIENIAENAPKKADAYVLGKGYGDIPSIENDFYGNRIYPVLYLHIQEAAPYEQKRISDFNLSRRARGLLRRHCVEIVGQLADVREEELLRYKNAGKKTINEIRNKILLPGRLDYKKYENE